MIPHWRKLRPGWYLLIASLVYGIIMTVVAARQGGELHELRGALEAADERPVVQSQPEPQPTGLWFPVPGAQIPDNDAYLPNSPRPYRQGVSQGFDFYDGASNVPVPYGAAVVAAAAGTVVRVDSSYREADPAEWERLMAAVGDGADETEMDLLRGRQVWLETDDGLVLRYAHLSAVREGLARGQRVERGRVIGYVGNTGTDEGVAGTRRGARLHFEIWDGDEFFGEGMTPDEVRIAAASLFTGP